MKSAAMNAFERYFTLCVDLGMIAAVALGELLVGTGATLAQKTAE